MNPIKFKIRISIAAFALVGLINAYGQTKEANSLYAAFDKTVQAKNSGLNNGKIHFNRYRSIDQTHRYFGADRYVIGEVVFDGQPYLNVSLKYDLLYDDLIIKLDGENNKMGFTPVKAKTESFYINGIKFTNLDLNPSHPSFVKGFYEQTDAGNGLTLYTKHFKNRFEVLTNELVFNQYTESNTFVVHYKDVWQEMNSQRDAIRIFPEREKEITDFFLMNTELEKSNRKQFMKNLIAYISNLLKTEAR